MNVKIHYLYIDKNQVDYSMKLDAGSNPINLRMGILIPQPQNKNMKPCSHPHIKP